MHEVIPPLQKSHRYPGCFQTLRFRTTLFQNLFLPFSITEWNKLDSDIKNVDSHGMFRKKLLTFMRHLENEANRIYDPLGVRLLNRFPTNTPRVFHIETTWKRLFTRRFNLKYTWCVCRAVFRFQPFKGT